MEFFVGFSFFAIEEFGDEAGGTSFAGAAGTVEKVGVANAVGNGRVFENFDGGFLTEEIL